MPNAHPLYSAPTIAHLFNLTERRVQQLAKEKVIPKPPHGKYELIGAVRGYIQYLKERASGQQSVATEYPSERLRLITAQANEIELSVAEPRAELVSIDELLIVWSRFSGDMIVRFMLLPTYF